MYLYIYIQYISNTRVVFVLGGVVTSDTGVAAAAVPAVAAVVPTSHQPYMMLWHNPAAVVEVPPEFCSQTVPDAILMVASKFSVLYTIGWQMQGLPYAKQTTSNWYYSIVIYYQNKAHVKQLYPLKGQSKEIFDLQFETPGEIDSPDIMKKLNNSANS